MKTYAVAYIDWSNHDLTTEFIQASNEVEAVKKHSRVQEYDFSDFPETGTMEEIKQWFFDCDSMVDVTEVPNQGEAK